MYVIQPNVKNRKNEIENFFNVTLELCIQFLDWDIPCIEPPLAF